MRWTERGLRRTLGGEAKPMHYEQLVQAAAGMSVEQIAAEVEAAGVVDNPQEVAALLARCAEDPAYVPPEAGGPADDEAPVA